jgi:hypothetical protein
MKSVPQSPVSHVVNVMRLPQKGMPVTIDADARQRALLAEQHGLLGVDRFHAELVVTSWKRNGVKVAGRVEADIEQECVVTLEPLQARISEEIAQIYLPEQSKLGRQGFHEGGEILLDAEGPDSPETFAGDTIDVGALAEEFFGLAIDPYPRKPGVALTATDEPDDHSAGGQLQEKLLSFTRKT